MSDWSLGLTMTIMGMGMVFLVLAILVVLVYLFNWIYYRYVERSRAPAEAGRGREPLAAGEPARQVPELSLEPVTDCLSPAKVAAIMAAITALAGPERGFHLVKVASSRGSLSWAAAGRQTLIDQRQQYLARKE